MIISQVNESLDQIAEVIAGGGVIAFRTDTFYGLGADPFNARAVQKIKALKGRGENKPILIVISDRDDIHRFIEQPSSAFKLLAEKFWPGPLTLIGQARSQVVPGITANTETVGLRLPADEELRALVRACGGALTATSANPANEPPSRTAQQVDSYFPTGIDLIVDGGAARTDLPSTVVDVTGAEPRLIREGVISWKEISAAESRG